MKAQFNPNDQTTFPGATPDERWTNYNRLKRCATLGQKIQLLWDWKIIEDMFEQNVWMRDVRLAGTWEDEERRRIEAEVMLRKSQKEAEAKAKAEAERQQEEMAALSQKLTQVMAADDTAGEIEVRMQIARLDKAMTPLVPEVPAYGVGYSGSTPPAAPARRSALAPAAPTTPEPKKEGGGGVWGFIVGLILCGLLCIFAGWLGGIGVAIIIAAWLMRNHGQATQLVVINQKDRD